MTENNFQTLPLPAKGYQTGSRGYWPEHRPPLPPDPIASAILTAATALRNEADSYIATIEPADEIAVRLGERVDAFDEAMRAVSTWLKEWRPELGEALKAGEGKQNA